MKFERNRNDEIATFVGGIENAVSIGKLEVGFGESFIGASERVVDIDFFEDVDNFLAVCTDVLNGSSSSETGDFAQPFDTGKV